MLTNISNIVNILTVFQLLVLIYVVASIKRKKRVYNFLFAFLLLNELLIVSSLLYEFNVIVRPNYPVLLYLFLSMFLLLGPLVFFYTKSFWNSNFTIKKNDFLHFLAPIFMFIFFLVEYFLRVQRTTGTNTFIDFTYTGYLIYSSVFLAQLLIYIVVSIIILKNYKNKIKSEYSFVEDKDLSWLQFLLILYFFHWLFDALVFILYISNVKSPELYSILGILSILTLLIFSTWIVIKSLKQSPIFFNVEQKEKYADSPLSKSASEMYITELVNYMETSKPFLEPSLKITDLANRLSIPSKSLSQSINQQIGKNFFDFVNSYRIEEAKNNIQKTKGNGKTILEILYDSGFNSKAAFNRAFKKHTGLTPSAYKKSIL